MTYVIVSRRGSDKGGSGIGGGARGVESGQGVSLGDLGVVRRVLLRLLLVVRVFRSPPPVNPQRLFAVNQVQVSHVFPMYHGY